MFPGGGGGGCKYSSKFGSEGNFPENLVGSRANCGGGETFCDNDSA